MNSKSKLRLRFRWRRDEGPKILVTILLMFFVICHSILLTVLILASDKVNVNTETTETTVETTIETTFETTIETTVETTTLTTTETTTEATSETTTEATTEGAVQLGVFEITGYCPCEKCCGKGARGITATGTKATAGRTIAVNPNVIPYGTKVRINGQEFIAEDTGGVKGNVIDMYFDTHDEALSWGRKHEVVEMVEVG